MKTIQIKQFDEKDERIAEALISLGMNKNVAMALTFLQNMNAATSTDIERGVNLRQPEVSIAVKQLKEKNWITERGERKIGKGRPIKVFSLKVGFNDIVNQLEKQHEKALDEARVNVERLKELENNSKN
ncbi:MAG TPA: transcriptional regulator protein [Candidatus Methanoperedens sp.]|nr:transcriptional regulator protein [Candidatus Methanoperedens sp.]